MALKMKLTGTEFESLSEDLQKEYKKSGDGYALDLTDYEDPAELRRAKDREKQEKREALEELKQLKAKLDKMDNEDARKKGDIDTLEKSWQRKLDEREASYNEALSKANASLTKLLVSDTAKSMASKLAGKNADILLPHIERRLTADLEHSDGPRTRVLDQKGELSAATLEDLSKEFVENDKFSSIVIASKASGSGALDKDKPQGSGAPKDVDLSKASVQDLLAHVKSRKENQE